MGLDRRDADGRDIIKAMIDRGDDGLRIGAGAEMAERAGPMDIAGGCLPRRVHGIDMGLWRRQADARRSAGCGKAIIAKVRQPNVIQNAAPGIEKAQAKIAHQPFIGGAGGEIDAAVVQVDRHRAGGMDDVGIDQRPDRMGESADRLQVMLEPVIGRYEREADQPGARRDRAGHVLQQDAPVARLNPGYVDALSGQFLIHGEGGVEMQRVGDDAATSAWKPQRAQHGLFAHGGRLYPCHFIGIGVDQPREAGDRGGTINRRRRGRIKRAARGIGIHRAPRAKAHRVD